MTTLVEAEKQGKSLVDEDLVQYTAGLCGPHGSIFDWTTIPVVKKG